MTQSPAPGRRVRHLLSALGLAVRSRPDYLTLVLQERRHVRQTKTDHHRLDQGPGDTAQGDPGTAALACGNGTGGGGYPEGVLLKAKPAFTPTRPKDVFGSLSYKGPAKSIADMEAGIAAEAKRRHARNRYESHSPLSGV